MDSPAAQLAALWPMLGLTIDTPRLRLRLPREDELPTLVRAARDIAGPGEPRLQLPWMYADTPDMERQLLRRHWRALAHWKPESWHLPLRGSPGPGSSAVTAAKTSACDHGQHG